MSLKFNFFNLLILFGTFQGILLAALINITRRSKANGLLSLLLLAFSLNTLKMMLFDLGLFERLPALHFYPFFFFLIGPAFYFYAKTLIGLQTERTALLIHFTPFLLNFLYYAICFAVQSEAVFAFHNNHYRPLEEFFSLISVGAYTSLTLKLLAKYKIWRRNFFSDDKTEALTWLRNLAVALCIGWLLWAAFYALDVSIRYFESFNGSSAYYPIYLYMSVVIYWIGYSGYVKREFRPTPVMPTSEKQARALSPEERKQLEALVKIVERDELYKQPALKLDDLAGRAGINTKQISFLLNQGLKKNFHDFINEMRIEAFKAKLRDPDNNNFTIQSLAEESGFRSRSTYHDLFQKYVNMTPKEYKDGEQN